MKKKLLTLTLAALMVFGLSACSASSSSGQPSGSASDGQQTEATSTDLLAQIQERGTIIIGTEGTWAPWTYHNENDELVGFDIEVTKLVAEKLGVEAEFVEGEWDGLLAGLEAGRYDTMANGVEITEDRNEKFDFSEPYAFIRTAIIVRSDNDEIASFEDLDGKTTANTISSTYAALAEQYGANPTGVDDLNQTIELLLAGRVDATLNAEVTYYDYIKEHPDAEIKIAALTEEASLVAFPLPKGEGSDSLRAAIDLAVAELMEDGSIAEISEKYFGADLTKE